MQHLKRYILAHECKWCTANLGRKSYNCPKTDKLQGNFESSTIVDPENPQITLTPSLTNHHEVTTTPQAQLAFVPISLGSLTSATPIDVEKLQEFSQTLLPNGISHMEKQGNIFLPAGTDLRIDWADARSIGRSGERIVYLLWIKVQTPVSGELNTANRKILSI